MRVRVKGWKEFQHYKSRKPPWIKLHRDLVDDFDFLRLPLASIALAPLLWLLASENEGADFGTVSADPEWISFRLRRSVEEIESGLKPLIEQGFLVPIGSDASNALAPRSQPATSEGEGETEEEAEREAEPRARTRGDGWSEVIERLLTHHNEELRKHREKTGGQFRAHKWPPKIRTKIRVELQERGEDGEQDFRDAICGLFRSRWHTDPTKNALTIQSVLNGTQLDRLADEYRTWKARETPALVYDPEEYMRNNPMPDDEDLPF